jgi:hypothetical protein
MIQKYFEFVKSDLDPIKSFYIKDELNPKVWKVWYINENVREALLKMRDFYALLS